MTVNIHGKEYKTVAERLAEFKKDLGELPFEIITEVQLIGDCALAKTTIRHAVKGSSGFLKAATGHAFEKFGSTTINKTSHIEVAETSAVGRALAFLGYAGTEIASADEVAQAISQQGGTAPAQAGTFGQDIECPAVCAACGLKDLDKSVVDFSNRTFGRTLCRKCQDIVRNDKAGKRG